MKITCTAKECDYWGILNHPQAHLNLNAPEVKASKGIECDINPHFFTMPDMIRSLGSIEPSLIESLEASHAACIGKSTKWKLASIAINEYELVLGFCDMEDSDKDKGELIISQCVRFPEFQGTFSAKVFRSGSVDEYHFKFYNSSEVNADGKHIVAEIEEYRNGEIHATETLARYLDGKWYLDSWLYD